MKSILIIFLLIALNSIAVQLFSQQNKIKLTVNNETVLTATLVDNSSSKALFDLIKSSPLTIEMSDYNQMEKVGPIGTTLPRNDEQITAESGDIILYLGSALVIYYAPNSYNFTRLGKIDNVSQNVLKNILGEGNVTVKIEVLETPTSAEHVDMNKIQHVIYPNPFKNYLEVSGDYDVLSILNEKGEEIIKSKSKKLDVSNLSSGIYFVKIDKENKPSIIQKVLKE